MLLKNWNLLLGSEKTWWEKEKMLVTGIQQIKGDSKSEKFSEETLKTLCEKEKMMCTNIFSFSCNVFIKFFL